MIVKNNGVELFITKIAALREYIHSDSHNDSSVFYKIGCINNNTGKETVQIISEELGEMILKFFEDEEYDFHPNESFDIFNNEELFEELEEERKAKEEIEENIFNINILLSNCMNINNIL